MNLAQLGLLRSVLSGPKPALVSQSTATNNGTPLTITIPRAPGKLCVIVVYSAGGTATPATLTGFTVVLQAATGTSPGYSFQYRFLDGTEAQTLTCAATSATGMVAFVYLFSGCVRTFPPRGAAGSSTGAANADPPNVNATTFSGSAMWFVQAAWLTGTQTVSGRPIGFSTRYLIDVSAAGLYAISAMEQKNIGTLDPSAFIASTSAGYRSFTGVIMAG